MRFNFFLLPLILLFHPSIQQEFVCDYELAVIPHPVATLCNLYVFCINYVGYLYECDPGQIFIPRQNVTPPYGECEDGYVEICERATTTTLPPPTTTIKSTTKAPPGSDNICHGVIFQRFPHPDNCYQYILCLFERAHVGECEPNQIFWKNWNICLRGNRETCETCIFC